ncbi:MAG TPA: glycosyltransferase [Solirubrobacterales bacterium]|nr:glycosyltransferase [Solirubrobacterales bacterium]
MRVGLVGYGTRGDVQPFVCLGHALAQRGHEVRLLVPRNGAPMARAAGLPTVELPLDVQQMFASPEAQRMLAAGRIGAFFRWLHREEKAYLSEFRDVLVEGLSDCDAIACHPLVEDRCAAVAERRGAAVVAIHFFPVLPSASFPSPFIAQRSLGPLNRTTHRLMLRMLWRLSREEVVEMRQDLGLPPARRSYTTAISRGEGHAVLAYSPALFPAPSDWAAATRPLGALAPSPQLRRALGEEGLPDELREWLGDGEPPVFLGFGSMPVLDAEGLLETTRRTLRRLGVRGVIGAGWSELPGTRDELVFSIASVDHQSLLPRCAAAVHHGGAGTVHASLAAGTPTLVCSVFADQPFWGRRCRALGVGETFPFKRLDERRLGAGLSAVLEPDVADAAGRLGRAMAAEDPTAAAIEALERAAQGSRLRSRPGPR